MAISDSFDSTGKRVAIAIFVAMVVDGMDLQMLALALPSIAKEFQVSSVMAGALGTYTLLGMGIGGVLAGWLADRIGRVRVTWWAILTFTVCTTVIGFCNNVLASGRDAVHLRLRHRGAVQHRHPARHRVHAHGHPHDCAGDPPGWLVGRLCRGGPALGVHHAADRMAPAVLLCRGARRGSAVDAPLAPRPTELDRRTHRGPQDRCGEEAVREDVGRGPDPPDIPAVDDDLDCTPVRLLRRQHLVAELPRQGSERQLAEHGLVRRGHLRDDGDRQGAHGLPGRHRRPAAHVDGGRPADGHLPAATRLLRHAHERAVPAADLRLPVRCTLRGERDLPERELSGERPRYSPWRHRTTSAAWARRSRP